MRISTPGRICLFGEHQDYLGLPVIAMAISLRVILEGKKRQDRKVIIHKPDLGETETFSLDDLSYTKPRDYFKSGIIVCKNAGLRSEEHTSELQSQAYLVCRPLPEKKKPTSLSVLPYQTTMPQHASH